MSGVDDIWSRYERRQARPKLAASKVIPLHSSAPAGQHHVDTGIKITRFADIQPALESNDLIEDYLGAGAMSVLYGESNSGKTFFATTMAFHVATGMEWFGRHVEKTGVIYCAMEGTHGISNRLAAIKAEHGGACDVPLGVVTVPLDLCMSDDDAEALVKAIKAESEAIGVPIGLIVMDTLSRAMAGGNENAPDDMGALVRNGDVIREATGAHLMWIHHSGKDQAKGARGHSSLRAATDTEIEICAVDNARTARVTKQREYDCSGEFAFSLKQIDLGKNKRGKMLTSCVVVLEGVNPTDQTKDRTRITPSAKRALELLGNKIGASGKPGHPGVPPSAASIPTMWWRDLFYECAEPGESQAGKQKAFRRAATLLIENRIVGMAADRVWIIQR